MSMILCCLFLPSGASASVIRSLEASPEYPSVEHPKISQQLRDHPLVAVRFKTKDDLPLDPDAPQLQTALRYTATGFEHPNDMQIFTSLSSTPLGADPFDEEGIRFTCMLELAQNAGELRLNFNGPHEQMFSNCRNLDTPKAENGCGREYGASWT